MVQLGLELKFSDYRSHTISAMLPDELQSVHVASVDCMDDKGPPDMMTEVCTDSHQTTVGV